MSAGDLLCIACSSSLPPRSGAKASKASAIFITICCSRPICPNCLASNPRLARYNPCLQCLAGVDIVSTRNSPYKAFEGSPQPRVNIDGGLHDGDVFTLGDDDEDEVDELERYSSGEETRDNESFTPSSPPPAYDSSGDAPIDDFASAELEQEPEVPLPSDTPSPSKYYIKSGDTLLGIALKYKVDGRLLCRLNNLPQSTLRTTPHLLHTRTVLTLPPSAILAQSPSLPERDSEYESRRTRERAEKRLQTLTKEVDWRVAKAYVALADPELVAADLAEGWKQETGDKAGKPKRTAPVDGGASSSNLEATAIDRYLDDEEWERQERAQGRGVSIPRFPLFESSSAISAGKRPAESKFWSGWKRN